MNRGVLTDLNSGNHNDIFTDNSRQETLSTQCRIPRVKCTLLDVKARSCDLNSFNDMIIKERWRQMQLVFSNHRDHDKAVVVLV